MTKPVTRKMAPKPYAQPGRAYFPAPFRGSIAEKLEAKTVRDPNSGCWLWAGDTNGKYPSIMLREAGKSIRRYAHRLSYEHFVGEIPPGMQIDHKCRTPMCINPDHLRCLTVLENIRSKPFHLQGSRSRKKNTHCPNGHEKTPANSILMRRDAAKGGDYVACRTCRQIAWNKTNGKSMRKPITFEMKILALLHRNEVTCGICGNRVMPGDKIDWDHIQALVHGGPHEFGNLRPVHRECHKIKTKADVQAKAKIDRILGITCNKPKRKIPSRPFRKKAA